MDLNKHIVTNDNHQPFHSSGFAQVANGDRLGAVSRVSFEQRRLIDRNRQVIDGYRRSGIGNSYGVLRPKPVVTPAQNNVNMIHSPANIGHQQFNSLPSRTYNPYA